MGWYRQREVSQEALTDGGDGSLCQGGGRDGEKYIELLYIEENVFLNFKLALERQKTAEKERLFLVYAKQWWREYLQIRPSHNSRLVKIFAQVKKVHTCI